MDVARLLVFAAGAAVAAAAGADSAADAPAAARYELGESRNVKFGVAVLFATLVCIQFGVGKGVDKNANRVVNGVHRGWD